MLRIRTPEYLDGLEAIADPVALRVRTRQREAAAAVARALNELTTDIPVLRRTLETAYPSVPIPEWDL